MYLRSEYGGSLFFNIKSSLFLIILVWFEYFGIKIKSRQEEDGKLVLKESVDPRVIQYQGGITFESFDFVPDEPIGMFMWL